MKKQGSILVVDDNVNILASLRLLLGGSFERVAVLPSPKRMLSVVAEEKADVVLLDMNFVAGINSGNEGLFWLQEMSRQFPKVPVVLFTAYADVDLAVKAMKQGAFDFIEKPWDNRKLVDVLTMALRHRFAMLKREEVRQPADEMFWGVSPQMMRLKEMVEKVAATDANVLITGENGTGKDLLAREVHRCSLRSGKQLVAVDMGSITESLFESELFGHVKGAFTDARSDRRGLIEEANGGTLFLDEVGNLQLREQSKLLNALQKRCVVRVGSNTPIPVDIRLVCATNKDIEKMVEEGTFREDLLYRINTIRLKLPPLRERRADILPLANRFMRHFASVYNRNVAGFGSDAEEALLECRWPGNIRELRHTVEKAVIICDSDTIGRADLQIAPSRKRQHSEASGTLEDMERSMIEQALEKYGSNLSLVASKLGVSRQTLYNKMKRYGIG